MTQQDSSISDFVSILSPIMTIFDNLEARQIGSITTPKIVLDKKSFSVEKKKPSKQIKTLRDLQAHQI